MKRTLSWLFIALIIVAVPAATYYLTQGGLAIPGTQAPTDENQAEQAITQNQTEDVPLTSDINKNQNNAMTDTTAQVQQKRVITPEAIAKAKNVPASLENPQGNFTLVAVIEGSDANRRLNQSLQIVGAQRQRLALLSQQFDQTPASSVQQRELIAGQINETRKTLEGNLQFMAQNYAYSLNNVYVLVPHAASLLAVTEEDGEAKTEPAYEFENASSYEDFQKKRDAYLRLKLEQVKAAQEAAKQKDEPRAVVVKDGQATPVAAEVPESDPAAEQDMNLDPTPEMKEKSEELQQLYNYDPEKNYQVDFQKTALYARAAR